MAISTIGWSWFTGQRNVGHDVHVLRNQPSPSLVNEIAYIEVIDEHHSLGFPVDHSRSKAEIKANSLEFVPLFPNVTNFGIAIDKATGSVTAGAPTGGATIHNFILGAQAQLASGASTGRVNLRVHIHDRVRRCWLTPSPLSIYRGGAGQRFTLLAEFETDGQPEPPLIGDLSWAAGVTWTATPASGISFTSTGNIKTTAATALGTVKVTATLPAHLGGHTSEPAEAEVVLGFDEQPQRHYQAVLRSGPGSARLMDVPNILLLSEGFQQGQEPDWDTLIGTLVDDLALTPALRPFDLFVGKGSVNIWSLFLPSRDRGSSVLHELRIPPEQSTWPLASEGMPLTRYNPHVLDVGSVLYQLGLPVRSDALPADPAAQKAAAIAKFAEWNLLTGFNLDPNDAFRFDTWKSWTQWSTRTLADERDTLLGVSFGVRPMAMNSAVNRLSKFHPFRVGRAELDKLLEKITDGDGPLIGQVWGPNGKDRSLVVALIGGGHRGGTESSDNLTSVSIHADPTIRVDKVDDPSKSLRVSVVPYELPRSILWGQPRMEVAELGTLVHELGHAFGLGDEYVEAGFFGKPRGSSSANLTLESELVNPASAVGDKLVGDKLRWRWPRILKAALLSDAPWLGGTSASADIVLPLRRGAKFMFKNGDVVYLRRRPLRGTVDKKLVLAVPSVPLVVTSDDQVGDQIIVRTQDGSNLNVADFPSAPGREPIVFFAVPPPAYAAARQETFADLTPLVIRDHITKTGLPLNRLTKNTCEKLDDAQRAALDNAPEEVNPFWLRTWVGAFDGGAQHPCGIFHPSPQCIMRGHSATTLFCPVCRYVLVDAVDPALHAEMDKDYAVGYVEPED